MQQEHQQSKVACVQVADPRLVAAVGTELLEPRPVVVMARAAAAAAAEAAEFVAAVAEAIEQQMMM